MRVPCLGLRSGLVASLALLLTAPVLPAARAADDKPGNAPEKRVAAGTCVTATASLLRREGPGKPWQVVKEGEEVFTGDELLGGIAAAVDSKDGAVRLVVVGDVDGRAPLPVLETVFVLHEPKDANLDVTLERGRIRLINLKKDGAAKVNLRVRQAEVEITLTEPGATVSLELYGRWPRGVPFRKDPKPGEEPVQAWTVVAIKGEVEIKGPRAERRLKAPPGLAVLEGDSSQDTPPSAAFLKELPAWAPEHISDMGSTELGKKKEAVILRWRKQAAEKGLGPAMDALLASDDPLERRFGVLMLGATDDLQRLGDLLRETKHQDVWDAAIIAVRHWIGRGPGQDQKLYNRLIERKYSPREAEGFLELLHSFGDEELTRPETYQMLINYLGSERTSLRELTYWHLYRLAPAGRKFGYDPLAPKEQRDAAIKEWRKLELPPPPTKEK
jgi:hypothetical protein